MLSGREGEVFDAVVVDEDHRGVMIQVVDPAVLARVHAHRVDPGDAVRVRLTAVDVPSRAHRVHPRRLSPSRLRHPRVSVREGTSRNPPTRSKTSDGVMAESRR